MMSKEFFDSIIDLKEIPRQGWIEHLGITNPESVADHSFSMTMMTMVLSDFENLDTEKVVRIALLHDLAEAKIGDVTPKMMSKTKKSKLEQKAITTILDSLPKKTSNKYKKLWKEYQRNSSKESRLVHDVDKLEMAFQAFRYSKLVSVRKNVNTFFESAKKEIKNENLKNILSKLLQDT